MSDQVSRNTQVAASLLAEGRSLRGLTLAQLEAWALAVSGSPATARQRASVAKSLLTFAHTTGYCSFNVGAALQPPKVPNRLAERILSQEDVFRLFSGAKGEAEAVLRFLYVSGLRASELCGLRWRDVQIASHGTVVLAVHGKGGRTRHVTVPAKLIARVQGLGLNLQPNAPLFATRSGAPLLPRQVHRFVSDAARRSGLKGKPSPHWLRHAHASHALDRHVPPHVVQATLGHASLTTTSAYSHVKGGETSARALADAA